MSLRVTFVGSGDAFGSGGRFQTCILVEAPGFRFAVDFGASSLIALKKMGIEHNAVDAVLLTHLHGDHAGGVPFLLVDAMLGSRRDRPLLIAGPRGTEARMLAINEALFPGMNGMTPKFPLSYLEIETTTPTAFGPARVTSYPAVHTAGTNPTAVRIEIAGKVIAYTGDGEWTEHVPELARDADLLIAECFFHAKPVRFHLNYPDIVANRDRLSAKRIVLTHMGPEMLAARASVPEQCAEDGLVLDL